MPLLSILTGFSALTNRYIRNLFTFIDGFNAVIKRYISRFVRIRYLSQRHENRHAGVSGKDRGLSISLSIHLLPYFVRMNKKCCGEAARLRRLATSFLALQ